MPTNVVQFVLKYAHYDVIVTSVMYRWLQLKDPSADVTDIAKQLADATAVVTHAQTPLQTGDLKLAVDVIEKISQRGFDGVPILKDEKARNIAQVCPAIGFLL